jgi:rhodanese-related sulfurtransferase
MTAAELHDRVVAGLPTIFIDVRDSGEFSRLNIGGNRIEKPVLESRLAELADYKATHKVVVGCVHFDSKRAPAVWNVLRQEGFDTELLEGFKNTGGGILQFSNQFPRFKIQAIQLKKV